MYCIISCLPTHIFANPVFHPNNHRFNGGKWIETKIGLTFVKKNIKAEIAAWIVQPICPFSRRLCLCPLVCSIPQLDTLANSEKPAFLDRTVHTMSSVKRVFNYFFGAGSGNEETIGLHRDCTKQSLVGLSVGTCMASGRLAYMRPLKCSTVHEPADNRMWPRHLPWGYQKKTQQPYSSIGR